MSNVTLLASGKLTAADVLTVELHYPANEPAVILIVWPPAPTVASPNQFPAVIAATYKVLASARVTLAQIKAGERHQTTD